MRKFAMRLIPLLFFLPTITAASMTISTPRCEDMRDPIGIDTSVPRFSWTLRENDSAVRGQCSRAFELRVAPSEASLSSGRDLLWQTSGKGAAVAVIYAGKPLAAGVPYFWQVRARDKDGAFSPWSAPSRFTIALKDWENARWIGETASAPSRLPKNCPRFRKAFFLADKPILHAYASVSGLGFYELYLNGIKVGNAVTSPANTTYSRHAYFDTLEVKDLMQSGKENRIGIWLGAGYSDDYSKWGWKWEQSKRAILHLRVTYADGTSQTVVTDSSWQMTDKSPLTYASLYNGEIYDASLEDAAWCTTDGGKEEWRPAIVLPDIRLDPALAPSVRVVESCHPVRIIEPKPGIFVADMGQNRAGWTRIRAKGPKGTKIVLRHSELAGKDDMIDPWTNRRAKATDTFLLAGTGGWETYEPRFTYHGFRFVEITGYPGRPTPEDITGCAVHADLEYTGAFSCSDDGLNKLFHAAHWSMLSNLQGIPTDCPARDERTPCQMDSQAYEDTAILTFWMPRFYAKWLDDIAGSTGNPDWNGDLVTLPWRLYEAYGDIRVLQNNYWSMAKQTDAVHQRFPNGYCQAGFGDWCPPNDNTWAGYHGDVELVNTAIFGRMLQIMKLSAKILGKDSDVKKYDEWLNVFLQTLNATLYHPETKSYGDGSQSTALLPLAFGLVPEGNRQAVVGHLLQTIRGKDKGRVDTGIFGTRYLGDVLCDLGQEDLAVSMMTQPEYPGFGYMFAMGATTLWEQWSFKGGMNSHNHAMFSGAAAFLFTRLGGIRAERPGYEVVGIHPVFPSLLTFAEATCETARGLVRSSWKREANAIHVELSIPVAATGICSFPAAKEEDVTESSTPFSQANGVHFIGMKNGRAFFTLFFRKLQGVGTISIPAQKRFIGFPEEGSESPS